MSYTEVEFIRNVATNGDGTKTVSFSRTGRKPVKKKITDQEASMLNAGKLTNPGNIRFAYLLKEGEKDPQPITLASSVPDPRPKQNF